MVKNPRLRKRFIVFAFLAVTFLLGLLAGPLLHKWRVSRHAKLVASFNDARDARDIDRSLDLVGQLVDAEANEWRKNDWKFERAKILLGDGRRAEGLNQLEALLDSDQRDEVLRYRAGFYFRNNEKMEARRDLQAVSRLFVGDYTLLGYCQAPREAVVSFSKAIESFLSASKDYQRYQKKELFIAYGARGTAHIRLGQYQAAFDDFDAAFVAGDESALAFASRASALSLLNRHEEATVDIQRAIEIEGDSAFNLLTKARTEIARGALKEASETLERAVGLYPDDVILVDLLSIVKSATGDGLGQITPGGWKKVFEIMKAGIADTLRGSQ